MFKRTYFGGVVSCLLIASASPRLAVGSASIPRPRIAQADTDSVARPQWCDSVTAIIDRRHIPVAGCTPLPGDSLAIRRALADVARALVLYGDLTGVPYPDHRYLLQSHPSDEENGGVSVPGGQDLSGALPDLRMEPDRPALTAKVIVHEPAHQWFGPTRLQIQGRSGWLTEGFSDFMTAQFWSARYGPQAEEEFLFFYNTFWNKAPDTKNTRPPTHASAAVNDAPGGGLFPDEFTTIPLPGFSTWKASLDSGDCQYYRGALVLWMLKQYLGDARFWRAMHDYLDFLAHRTQPIVSSDDFQRVVEKTAGESLDWFFKEWVFRAGYPQFVVTSTYDASAHTVVVHVTQAAPVFRMPVTIRVGTTAGDVLAHATLNAPDQTITIPHVMQSPMFVVFDDGDAIVKTLQFDQPTAWLQAQVQREARPWQTWWAIDQLRERAGRDTQAAAVLSRAARYGGRYALTRAQAMVALGNAPPHIALPALQIGLQDTSVLVRRGALEGLAQLGTPQAKALERGAFEHDQSMIVRDYAMLNLTTSPSTPSADRHAILMQALSQRTYEGIMARDAINANLPKRKVQSIQDIKKPYVPGSGPPCDTVLITAVRENVSNPDVTTVIQSLTTPMMLINRSMLDINAPQCKEAFGALLPRAGASSGSVHEHHGPSRQ